MEIRDVVTGKTYDAEGLQDKIREAATFARVTSKFMPELRRLVNIAKIEADKTDDGATKDWLNDMVANARISE